MCVVLCNHVGLDFFLNLVCMCSLKDLGPVHSPCDLTLCRLPWDLQLIIANELFPIALLAAVWNMA